MGNRSGVRGGSRGPGGVDGPGRNRGYTRAMPRPSLPLPVTLALRARRRQFAPHPPSNGERRSPLAGDGYTVDELLAAWIACARGVHEPDTLDDCADYSRYLDEVNRAAQEADDLLRRLRERLADWVATQTHRTADGAATPAR